LIERLIKGAGGRGLAWALLGFGMLVSAAVCLYVTRGTTFSGDESTWVAFAPNMDLQVALEPHSGHLVLVSHLLYKLVLETIGSDYLTFRVLTLLTVFASVALFFAWASRRIGHWLALAPCLVLLFFGSDTGHLLQGNGFTIMLAIACGMAALVALDRDSRGGDVACCAALCLGTVTYSTALPFIVGVAVIVLARSDRWKRAWVFLVPAAIYVAWRVWVQIDGVDFTRGGADPANLLLLPAWTFQSLSGVLSALTGLNYNFQGGGWVGPTELAGPSLALAFVLALGWRVSRGTDGVAFWAVVAIALAMFASQVLTWIPGVREAGTSRYLFPGAFVVLIVAVEAVRGRRASPTAFVAVWLVALAGFGSNVMIVRDTGATLRNRAVEAGLDVTAARLVHGMGYFPPGPNAKPLASLVEDPALSIMGGAARRYGGLGTEPDQIAAQSPEFRAGLDAMLIQVIDPTMSPLPPGSVLRGCHPAARVGSSYVAEMRSGVRALRSERDGTLGIGRFGDEISSRVGSLPAGRPQAIGLPLPDEAPQPWKLSSDVPFEICDKPAG